MNIYINGEKKEVKKNITITEILKDLGITDMVMACAVNTEIVKKEKWASYAPKEDDKLEFLEFVGGG